MNARSIYPSHKYALQTRGDAREQHVNALKQLTRKDALFKGFRSKFAARLNEFSKITRSSVLIVYDGDETASEVTFGVACDLPPTPNECARLPIDELYGSSGGGSACDDRLVFVGTYKRQVRSAGKVFIMYYLGALHTRATNVLFSRTVNAGTSLQANMPLETTDRKFVPLAFLKSATDTVMEMMRARESAMLTSIGGDETLLGVKRAWGKDELQFHSLCEGFPAELDRSVVRRSDSFDSIGSDGRIGRSCSSESACSHNASSNGSVSDSSGGTSIIASGRFLSFVMTDIVPTRGQVKITALQRMLERTMHLVYCNKEWGLDRFGTVITRIVTDGYNSPITWQCARMLVCVAAIEHDEWMQLYIDTEVDVCGKMYRMCHAGEIRSEFFRANGFYFDIGEMTDDYKSDDVAYFKALVRRRVTGMCIRVRERMGAMSADSSAHAASHKWFTLVQSIRTYFSTHVFRTKNE